MKIAVCVPAYGDTKARFTLSLFALANYMAKRSDIELALHMVLSTPHIGRARERLGELALESGADFLLWLDADQTFPPETAAILLSHGLPMVGCNYRKRNPEAVWSSARIDGKHVAPRSEGLQPVDTIGFGVLLMASDVLRTLPRPWFLTDLIEGEDTYFCKQARNHDIQPYIDHALSMHIGHVAETVLTFPGE